MGGSTTNKRATFFQLPDALCQDFCAESFRSNSFSRGKIGVEKGFRGFGCSYPTPNEQTDISIVNSHLK